MPCGRSSIGSRIKPVFGFFTYFERMAGMGVRLVLVFAVLMAFFAGVAFAVESDLNPRIRSFGIRYVTDRQQMSTIVDQFRDKLRNLDSNAGLIGCRDEVELTESGVKNVSFGAVCTIQKGNDKFTLLTCADSSAGELKFGESGDLSRQGIVAFMKKNCPPGK